MKDEIPRIILPVVEIKPEDNRDKIDSILETWIPSDEPLFDEVKTEILESPNAEAIIALLDEYKQMMGLTVNNENTQRVAMITRDLKKLGSPVFPDLPTEEFKQTRFWTEWTIDDIEREYFMLYRCLKKEPEIAPAKRYLKGQIHDMLHMLVTHDVIYTYKHKDLFVNSIRGELNSYFRNYKTIRVQKL